jgi:hypothetical protein
MQESETMSKQIDFWFDFASTYSYLSALRIEPLAAARGVTVRWRPFLLGPVFTAMGWNDSPFNIYPSKGRYMWRDMRTAPLKKPSRFPRNGIRPARVICAHADATWVPDFARAVFSAGFAQDLDIGERGVVAGLPTVMRRNWSMRGALKWRTMIAALAQFACASSAPSRCGWRAKMKLAAEGSTSKPSACSSATSLSRVAITLRQLCSKYSSSSTDGDRAGDRQAVERVGVEAVLDPLQASIRSAWPTAKPTRRPASERTWRGVHHQQVRVAVDQRDRALAAEVDIGLVDHHHRIRVGGDDALDLGQRQQAAGRGVRVGEDDAAVRRLRAGSPRRGSRSPRRAGQLRGDPYSPQYTG